MKYGIDERDSMLTRENFFAAWAKPKDGNKGKKGNKKVETDEMAVDEPTKEVGSEVKDVEMDIHQQSQGGPKSKLTGRSSSITKLPIFRFQRKGIGLSHTQKPNKPKSNEKAMDLN